MRLLVLSRQRILYSTRRFREAAVARGHEVRVLDPFACSLAIERRPSLYAAGRKVAGWDCSIPRVGTRGSAHATAVVAQLETMGVAVVNRAEAILRARDKLRSLQCLSAAGLPLPRTVAISGPAELDRVLDRVGGPPVVLKLLQGTQGVGVILAETRSAAEATLETLWALGESVLVQEFVVESKGRDVRVLVVGGEVVAAMRRTAREGEWRSNLHRGGGAAAVDLEPAYGRTAVEAVRAVGLGVAGVDLLETRDGPRVMEVNASPGFEGLERATGVDIADAVVAYAESLAGGDRDRFPEAINPPGPRSV